MTRINNPVLVIGVLVSITVSLVLLIVGIDTISSVIFGLLGVIISLLIDLIDRVIQQEKRTFHTIGYSQQLFSDTWFHERMLSIFRSWEKLPKTHPMFRDLAQKELQGLHDELERITSGEYTAKAPDYSQLSLLIQRAKNELKATAVVHALGWWDTPTGQYFWQRNVDAIARKVTITRIFIYDNKSPELESLMSKMHSCGVKVLMVTASQVPRDLLMDFIVADENLVWTTRVAPDFTLDRHSISSKPQDIAKALDVFRQLEFHAVEFHPSSDKPVA